MLGYPSILFFFFFNDTATTEIYTLSLHDALPICSRENRTLRLRCITTSRCKAFPAPPASPATTPRVRLPSAPSVTSAASPSRGRSSHHDCWLLAASLRTVERMKLSAKFARQESEAARQARIARRRIRGDRVVAIRQMLGLGSTDQDEPRPARRAAAKPKPS